MFKEQLHALNDNKETITEWLNSHAEHIVKQIAHTKEADELQRLAAKLNQTHILIYDIENILDKIEDTPE